MKYLLLLLFSINCYPCGSERWKIKVGTDHDINRLNQTIIPTTIKFLNDIPQPEELPADNRIEPWELNIYEVEANLIKIKSEADGDSHMVLESNGSTMIAELPDLDCMGHNNPLSDRVKGAIAVINDMNFKSKLLPIKIKINGIFFFDFKHGQTGVAKNGGELHPVLHIELLE